MPSIETYYTVYSVDTIKHHRHHQCIVFFLDCPSLVAYTRSPPTNPIDASAANSPSICSPTGKWRGRPASPFTVHMRDKNLQCKPSPTNHNPSAMMLHYSNLHEYSYGRGQTLHEMVHVVSCIGPKRHLDCCLRSLALSELF